MKNKILDFSIMKVEISQNNVLEMAELIAFMELRFHKQKTVTSLYNKNYV